MKLSANYLSYQHHLDGWASSRCSSHRNRKCSSVCFCQYFFFAWLCAFSLSLQAVACQHSLAISHVFVVTCECRKYRTLFVLQITDTHRHRYIETHFTSDNASQWLHDERERGVEGTRKGDKLPLWKIAWDWATWGRE